MLTDEIDRAQRQVKTEALQLSIGEIVNMYKDGELIINPEFQRLFRWEIGQKSKFVESILLGIPIPSIFVFETADSTWELVDGLQRVSTLLEFMGHLRESQTSELKPGSKLVATKYLPSLDNVVWDRQDQLPSADQVELESSHKLAIRRARISVEVLKKPSNNDTKYDLFQRLNAGGTPANAQELRNCIVIMVNRSYHDWMKRLAEDKNFLEVLDASEEQIEKQRHMEFVNRFLVYTFVEYDGKLDVEEYINEGIIKLANTSEIASAQFVFSQTFQHLKSAFGKDVLRRFVGDNPQGRVGLSAFEVIAVGVAKNLESIGEKAQPVQFIQERIREFWRRADIDQFVGSGVRGTTRIQRTIQAGKSWFST